MMAAGKRPVPFRTRKLSPPALMVLLPGGSGRVGYRRPNNFKHQRGATHTPGLLLAFSYPRQRLTQPQLFNARTPHCRQCGRHPLIWSRAGAGDAFADPALHTTRGTPTNPRAKGNPRQHPPRETVGGLCSNPPITATTRTFPGADAAIRRLLHVTDPALQNLHCVPCIADN